MAKRKRKRTQAEIRADKSRTGRPPKAPSERQSEQIMVYLTPTERAQLEKLAKQEGLSLASMIMRPWREQKED